MPMRERGTYVREVRLIYMLTINDRPCYIGMTMLKRMKQRKKDHSHNCSCDTDAKLHLNAAMNVMGLSYRFVILEVIDEDSHTLGMAKRAERRWIFQMLEVGAYLLNKHEVPQSFLGRSGMNAAKYHAHICLHENFPIISKP